MDSIEENDSTKFLKEELKKALEQNQKLALQIEKLTNTIHDLSTQLRMKSLLQTENDYSSDESTLSTLSAKRRKTISNRNKLPQVPQNKSLPTHNRYETLEDMELETNTPEPEMPLNEKASGTPKVREPKPNTKPPVKKPQTIPNTNAPEPEKVPPIILRSPEKWTTITKALKSKSINYTRATTIADGIKIQPETTEDYRKLTKHFDNEKIEYHTYQLLQDKELKIVIRGLPYSTITDEIKDDLEEKGFNPTRITQMSHKITKAPMPLFLIALPRSNKDIYKITNILGLSISIENLKVTGQIAQCYRCQKFGHTQSFCTAAIKCVKCGEGHRAAECIRIKEKDKPTCANCGNDHVASYRGCPKVPKISSKPPPDSPKKHTSYANAAKNNSDSQSNIPRSTTQTDKLSLETLATAVLNLTRMLQEIKSHIPSLNE